MAATLHAGGDRQSVTLSRWRLGLRRKSYCSRERTSVGWTQYRRSTVGLSGLEIGECARYVADWLRGKAPPSPRDGFSAPLILRFAVDDLKAYCLEAAAGLAKPSSRQLGDWFWNETAAGASLYVLRDLLLTQEDERLRLIVANFMVPAARARTG